MVRGTGSQLNIGAGRERVLIGMVHVRALPGTPRGRDPVVKIIDAAVRDAGLLHQSGFDAILIENMHDLPYLAGGVGPEIVATMTAAAVAVRRAVPIPLGVQVLAGAGRETLAVALAAGAAFVRIENFVFAHVADEGLMPTAAAGPLLRYRRAIGADHIRVFADVKKKHASHALTADLAIGETAAAAEFSGADGLIVTGASTGKSAEADDLRAVRGATRAPLLIGSGLTADNLERYWDLADGFIVGSSLKRGGVWSGELDPGRARAFVAEAKRLRKVR